MQLELTGKVVGDLKPGDVVVVTVKAGWPLTLERAELIREQVESVLPEGVRCLVAGPEFSFDVLRPDGGVLLQPGHPVPA